MSRAYGILDAFRDNPRTRHPALLVRHDGSEDAVTITEFTQGGFRLEVSLRPNLGERVLIRWAHGAEAGGSYVVPFQ